MIRDHKEGIRLDVLELTGDLRTASDWSTLRKAILAKGLQVENLALPLYVEDESGNECGLLVSLESVYEFQFNEDSNSFKKWVESSKPSGVYDDSQEEVKWIREMLSNGSI